MISLDQDDGGFLVLAETEGEQGDEDRARIGYAFEWLSG
ncbi:hypothetical protein SAMN05444162_2834 [Paenibacillaceae bacterium GAS479]|nr:hypothetical protein SAMN05444162_2834 [Paenibacillaceae bacterium GAS479]